MRQIARSAGRHHPASVRRSAPPPRPGAWLVLLLALAVLGFRVAPAAADPLTVHIESSEGALEFGDNATLWISSSYTVVEPGAATGITLGADLVWDAPLLAASPGATRSRYAFGSGPLTIAFHWMGPGGTYERGSFVGTLDGLSFEVVEDVAEPYAVVDAWGNVGRGMLDRNLARFLGVKRRGTISEVFLALDDITGEPGGTREGFTGCCSTVDLEFDMVPEPAVLLLVGAGGAWLLRRRRRRA